MKYKVGDRIAIRKDLVAGMDVPCHVVPEMEVYAGKTLKILSAQGKYYVTEGNIWSWSEEMVDHEATAQLGKGTDDTDMVNHPPHYTHAGIEAIEVIDAFFENNYYLGQVFKYTSRAGHKGNELEDLKKAQWYLNRYIKEKEGK